MKITMAGITAMSVKHRPDGAERIRMEDCYDISDTPLEPEMTHVRNYVDGDGNPAGGEAIAPGMRITWQDGPTKGKDGRYRRSGAFVEEPIMAAVKRLEFYQTSKFASPENDEAIEYLRQALMALKNRRVNRYERGVYGTNEA